MVSCTLVHFGAVVADAPSPLSTPRSATGQAQLRLGKPLRMKCRASPVLLFMRAGRVVSGTVGIVRATVPFHGEHDAPEPTKDGLRFSTVRLPTPRCVCVSVNLFSLSLSRCDCCGCVCCFSGTPLFRRVSGAGAARAPAPGSGFQRPAPGGLRFGLARRRRAGWRACWLGARRGSAEGEKAGAGVLRARGAGRA